MPWAITVTWYHIHFTITFRFLYINVCEIWLTFLINKSVLELGPVIYIHGSFLFLLTWSNMSMNKIIQLHHPMYNYGLSICTVKIITKITQLPHYKANSWIILLYGKQWITFCIQWYKLFTSFQAPILLLWDFLYFNELVLARDDCHFFFLLLISIKKVFISGERMKNVHSCKYILFIVVRKEKKMWKGEISFAIWQLQTV